MPPALIKQGMIVWVNNPAARGGGKRRPVVVISVNEAIEAGERIVGVAITTTFSDPPPHDHVELPWDPTGRASTRLRRRSAAVCNWKVLFLSEEAEATAGFVPAPTLESILQKAG